MNHARADGGISPRPLRVLHLLLWIIPGGGGIQTYLRALLQSFRGADDVRMAGAAVNAGEAVDGFAEPPYLGRPGDAPWRRALRFLGAVRRAAREAHVVQIHGIYGAQFLLGAPCCWLLGVPYIVTPLNALAPLLLEHKAWKKRLFFATWGGFFLRKAASVLGTSAPEADFLRQRFPRANTQLVLVGIDVPPEPQVEFLAAGPTAELRLLYLGSFDPWKRVPMLVRAVAALRARGIDARLVIGGKGPDVLRQPVIDEIARQGMGEVVTMAGYVAGAQKLELLRRSHVLVLPAATDSYSLATAEALAEGLPVVITEGAGAAPDVRRHACGAVIPIDDERALVEALAAYIDPALRRQQALAAHRYARAVLDLSVLRSDMTALYREYARARP